MSVDRRTFLGLGSLATASARVVCLGDLAWCYGHRADYVDTRPLLDRLAEAGIELTLGMGNHDRRENFLSVWPEYRRRTLVRDRSVFKRWLCFPSTGSWGDIGFVAMRTEPGRARAELVLLEHFYPNPNQRSWLDEEIVAVKRCCACTFRW